MSPFVDAVEILGRRDVEIECAWHLQLDHSLPVKGGTMVLAWVHSMLRSVWPQRSRLAEQIEQLLLLCSACIAGVSLRSESGSAARRVWIVSLGSAFVTAMLECQQRDRRERDGLRALDLKAQVRHDDAPRQCRIVAVSAAKNSPAPATPRAAGEPTPVHANQSTSL